MSSIIARQPLPSPAQSHILVDLVALLEAAVPQIHGSDERAAIEEFLLRNTEPQQIVSVPVTCLRNRQWFAQRLRANTAPRWAELRGGAE